MLQVILACYKDFEERVGLLSESGVKSTSYDIVKSFVKNKIGKFDSAEVIANCPMVGRSSALSALKKLTSEGIISKNGNGKNTFYVKTDCFDE